VMFKASFRRVADTERGSRVDRLMRQPQERSLIAGAGSSLFGLGER
jgi:hypothetical protein